uniref:Cyclic nucleotide-binding domain-containing protein n=1 Tax=Ascaris lumbricoides TaxID=6252 RepID=A0A0M3HG59_ASCLU
MFNYNEKLIIGFGGSPAALMKSGCTITTLIAVDRIFALYFPMKYYVLKRRRINATVAELSEDVITTRIFYGFKCLLGSKAYHQF